MENHEVQQDYLASEMLRELSADNRRKGHIILAELLVILLVVAGFLWYLYQYDFSGYDSTVQEANGVYAIVDSEGNVVSSDLTPEDIARIMEGMTYGDSESNHNQSQTQN